MPQHSSNMPPPLSSPRRKESSSSECVRNVSSSKALLAPPEQPFPLISQNPGTPKSSSKSVIPKLALDKLAEEASAHTQQGLSEKKKMNCL